MDYGYIQRVAPPPAHDRRPSGGRFFGWFAVGSSMFWPRVFILALWIFGSQLGRAFDSWVVPAIGFFVLPWTTVAYAFMWSISSDRVAGVEWVVVGLAFIADLLTWSGLLALRR
jgi:hypothetical protein